MAQLYDFTANTEIHFVYMYDTTKQDIWTCFKIFLAPLVLLLCLNYIALSVMVTKSTSHLCRPRVVYCTVQYYRTTEILESCLNKKSGIILSTLYYLLAWYICENTTLPLWEHGIQKNDMHVVSSPLQKLQLCVGGKSYTQLALREYYDIMDYWCIQSMSCAFARESITC